VAYRERRVFMSISSVLLGLIGMVDDKKEVLKPQLLAAVTTNRKWWR
jgi:hypothetical protein